MQDRPLLLFDVMDTLVYNPFRREVPQFFGLTQAELLQQKDPHAWVQFETGEINEAEYFRRYFNDGRTFNHAEFARVAKDAYRWMAGAELLLQRLKHQGFEIHALSNYPIWYRTIEARLRLSRYLEWTFVSCFTGLRKPAPEAYLGAARTLQRLPGTCLFIDDSPANCQAALAIGMPAIHFVDAASLWSELLRRGVVQ